MKNFLTFGAIGILMAIGFSGCALFGQQQAPPAPEKTVEEALQEAEEALIRTEEVMEEKGGGEGGKVTAIRDAVFGNVGTMMSFKVGADDAEYMTKEYAPVLTEADVIGIANYKAYIKLNIKNTTSRAFSLETIYDASKANKKVREIVKQYSRMKYGRKREFVDQEISARIGIELG